MPFHKHLCLADVRERMQAKRMVPLSDTIEHFSCTQVADGMGFTVLSENSLLSSHSLAELLQITLCPKILKQSPKESATESQTFSYTQ